MKITGWLLASICAPSMAFSAVAHEKDQGYYGGGSSVFAIIDQSDTHQDKNLYQAQYTAGITISDRMAVEGDASIGLNRADLFDSSGDRLGVFQQDYVSLMLLSMAPVSSDVSLYTRFGPAVSRTRTDSNLGGIVDGYSDYDIGAGAGVGVRFQNDNVAFNLGYTHYSFDDFEDSDVWGMSVLFGY